jgi:hypothetical protein
MHHMKEKSTLGGAVVRSSFNAHHLLLPCGLCPFRPLRGTFQRLVRDLSFILLCPGQQAALSQSKIQSTTFIKHGWACRCIILHAFLYFSGKRIDCELSARLAQVASESDSRIGCPCLCLAICIGAVFYSLQVYPSCSNPLVPAQYGDAESPRELVLPYPPGSLCHFPCFQQCRPHLRWAHGVFLG